jgi:tRNA U55 pseudouridine synthase TruB
MNPVLTRSIVLLDKPAGISSFRAAQIAARKLHLRKAGHTGTLDTDVTGVLVVALEEATKAISQLMGLDKGYEGVLRLSERVGERELRAACRGFVGRIVQLPPIKCAVKRRPRERTVYAFDIAGFRGDEADFRVEAQAGTYVRALLRDLGAKLGCQAGMVRLRRTHVGPFELAECVQLKDLRPEDAMDVVRALERVGLETVTLTAEEVRQVQKGRPIARTPRAKADPSTKVLVDADGRLQALARWQDEGLRPFRVLSG